MPSATSNASPATPAGSTSPAMGVSQQHAGAVLLIAAAVALSLFVAFVGVLQSAVQRGDLFRQQLSIGNKSERPVSATDGIGNSLRFDAGQRSVGAPVAPRLLSAMQSSR